MFCLGSLILWCHEFPSQCEAQFQARHAWLVFEFMSCGFVLSCDCLWPCALCYDPKSLPLSFSHLFSAEPLISSSIYVILCLDCVARFRFLVSCVSCELCFLVLTYAHVYTFLICLEYDYAYWTTLADFHKYKKISFVEINDTNPLIYKWFKIHL